jgi:TatD DNase family protein
VRLFDTHAHLTDESFAAELDASLARAAERGVGAVVSVASDLDDAPSDLDDARAAIDLARMASRPRIWATAGIHPHHAERWTPATAAQLEELAGSQPVVAIGETGLGGALGPSRRRSLARGGRGHRGAYPGVRWARRRRSPLL